MSQRVLLLHGWGGSDAPHWQSWLAGEIAKEYGTVSFLKLSNFDMPDLNLWKKELMEHLEVFQPDIVICHSLANILWFHLCHDEILTEIQKLYLVAPPSLACKIQELQSFFPLTLPTNLYAKRSLLIASSNDPYMSAEEAQKIAKVLKIDLHMMQEAGHINTASGFGAWPWMLEEISS